MSIQDFWQAYLATLPADHPHHSASYSAEGFGDSPQMAEELGQLIVQGVKTATASLLWAYEAENAALPQVGSLCLVLDGQDQPLCLIETYEVSIHPYNEVGEQQAYEEGEGDRSLAYWRAAHWDFFTRACASIGRTPIETMPIVCERFRVLYRAVTPA